MELVKYTSTLLNTFDVSDSLDDLEYTLYWSGKRNGERREAGVGFAIKMDIVAKLTEMRHPVNDSIMTMRFPLRKEALHSQIRVQSETSTVSTSYF